MRTIYTDEQTLEQGTPCSRCEARPAYITLRNVPGPLRGLCGPCFVQRAKENAATAPSKSYWDMMRESRQLHAEGLTA